MSTTTATTALQFAPKYAALGHEARLAIVRLLLSANPDGLVVGEIQQGVTRLRRKDPRQAAAYEAWLGKLRHEFAGRVLPVSQEVALEWGRLSAANPPPVIDGLMAATARVHGLTVVTRNVADFEPTGVALLNPFEN